MLPNPARNLKSNNMQFKILKTIKRKLSQLLKLNLEVKCFLSFVLQHSSCNFYSRTTVQYKYNIKNLPQVSAFNFTANFTAASKNSARASYHIQIQLN